MSELISHHPLTDEREIEDNDYVEEDDSIRATSNPLSGAAHHNVYSASMTMTMMITRTFCSAYGYILIDYAAPDAEASMD